MATKQVTYTGSVPVDQPTLGLHWEPGQTQPVDDELADLWTSDPASAFSGPRTKDAQQAKATAAAAGTPEQQPANGTPAGGES